MAIRDRIKALRWWGKKKEVTPDVPDTAVPPRQIKKRRPTAHPQQTTHQHRKAQIEIPADPLAAIAESDQATLTGLLEVMNAVNARAHVVYTVMLDQMDARLQPPAESSPGLPEGMLIETDAADPAPED